MRRAGARGGSGHSAAGAQRHKPATITPKTAEPPTTRQVVTVSDLLTRYTREHLDRNLGSGSSVERLLRRRHQRYLAAHNKHPKPFVWTAAAASILAKLEQIPASSV